MLRPAFPVRFGVGAFLIGALATAGVVLAWAGEHGGGDPDHPFAPPGWPAELVRIANRTDRVGGFWVNFNDELWYDGDARACSDFLREFARVPRPGPTLSIEPPPRTTNGALAGVEHDWVMQVSGTGDGAGAGVTVRLGGHIDLAGLEVPLTLAVQPVLDSAPADLREFVATHAARRAAAPASRPSSQPTG